MCAFKTNEAHAKTRCNVGHTFATRIHDFNPRMKCRRVIDVPTSDRNHSQGGGWNVNGDISDAGGSCGGCISSVFSSATARSFINNAPVGVSASSPLKYDESCCAPSPSWMYTPAGASETEVGARRGMSVPCQVPVWLPVGKGSSYGDRVASNVSAMRNDDNGTATDVSFSYAPHNTLA